MGVETEYALGRTDARAHGGSPAHLSELVLRRAYSDLDCLRSRSGHGVFLANGALLYVDVGAHVEFATAECRDPLEATRQVFAGDRLLHDLVRRVEQDGSTGNNTVLLKNNVDNRGATWGSHESYAVVTRPHDFAVPLASFLATRIIYAGSGGLEQRGRALRFVLSPRASFIERAVSASSTHARGILHDKHESLACAPFHRLHLTCGDSLRSHYATWLRLGATALVVSALESGSRPGRNALLPLPVKALHRVNADPRLRSRMPVASGARLNPIEVQRLYLDMVEAAGRRGMVPAWWPALCREWRAVLDGLDRDPGELAGRLDWPLRLRLFEAHLARKGLSWQQARLAPNLPHETPLLPWGDQLDDPEILRRLTGGRRRGRRPRERERRAEPPLADELREIDIRFGELGPGGLHARLDDAGLIAHRLFDELEVARGAVEPPRSGRGRARGLAIKKLARGDRRERWASWTAVADTGKEAYLDLRHPLRDRVEWRVMEASPSAEEPAPPEDVPF